MFKHNKAKEKIGTDRKKERKRNGPPFDHKFNFKVLLCAAVTICGNQLVVNVYVTKCGWHTFNMCVSKCGNTILHIL